ncbi:ACSL4 [Cordylochernes scorpioides]|uniref:ACSL4 n=1 Tax=Cordylochernes scorpioides TaxID=51811 RepID=A0ABY6KZ50_9ARAC|nr:ACSL4 [Cordylochernes scorpioides]
MHREIKVHMCAVNDRTIGVVGPPVSIAKIKLIDWPEGNYYTMDKPNPRGEIVVGGPCVAMGYFKQPGLTAENFTGPDADGTRWFLTGDIGEVLPNGNLKIIDRKKDLVKLQFGEYISLGKVEAVLKCCALVENMCVIGNSYQSFLVALVSPNKNQLKKLAKELGQNPESPVQDLCSDSAISAAATKMIAEYGLKNRLSRTEVPTKYKLCSEEWLPDSGLVTAAYKIRRKMIEQFYQKDIEMLYSSSN